MTQQAKHTASRGSLKNVRIIGAVKPYEKRVPAPKINLPHWVEGDLFNVTIKQGETKHE